MKSSRMNTALLLILSATLLIIVGCSSEQAPLSPLAANNDHSTGAPQAFQYPPLTSQFLADGPAPGFRIIPLDFSTALDDGDRCDSASASGRCDREHDKTVKIDHFVEFKVLRGQMTSDTTISIVAPSGCYPVADFYPHPYQFDGMVMIKWKVREMGFPHDFDYSTLVPWYYNDAGEYIPVEYEWRGNYHELVIWTNHFSRYIITQVVNG